MRSATITSAEQFLVQIRTACKRPLQVRSVFGQHGRELVLACAAVLLDASERRMRIVLDHGLYALGFLLAFPLGYQVQRHVDSSRRTCRRDEPAILHPVSLDVVHPQFPQELSVRRVGGCLPTL